MIARIFVADLSGRFEIPAGYGFELQPYENAFFPLQARVRTESGPDDELRLEEERPQYKGERFRRIEVTGAAANSKWLGYVAETPTEILGSQNGLGRGVELFSYTRAAGAMPSGLYNVSHAGASAYVYDLRRFRQVLLTATSATINIVSGAELIRAFLSLSWGRSDAGVSLYSGFSLEAGDGTENLASIAGVSGYYAMAGEGCADATTPEYTTRSGRFPFASVFLVASGGPIELTSNLRVALWGFP